MASKVIVFKLRLYHDTGQTRTGPRVAQIKVLEGSLVFCLCTRKKPIRIQSINGREYILVIVDDFSHFMLGLKDFLMILELLLLSTAVNAAGTKVTSAKRLQLLEEFMLTEKRSKTYQRKNKDFLMINIT
ncbi:hypothetical protein Tco_1149671 [Tanacetum coccineum]